MKDRERWTEIDRDREIGRVRWKEIDKRQRDGHE